MIRGLQPSFATTNNFIFPRAIFLSLCSFFLSLLSALTDSFFVPSFFHALARKLEKCNGRYLVVARCIQAVALTGGTEGGEKKEERKRDKSRHGGQFSGTCIGNLPPRRFSPLLCACLPRALYFLFLLHPSCFLVFKRKRETLEVANDVRMVSQSPLSRNYTISVLNSITQF